MGLLTLMLCKIYHSSYSLICFDMSLYLQILACIVNDNLTPLHSTILVSETLSFIKANWAMNMGHPLMIKSEQTLAKF